VACEFGYDFAVVLFASPALVSDHQSLNATLASFHQTWRQLDIADDDSDFGIEAAFANRVKHSGHVRSAAGY
jgi:hypothetical protein